MTFKQELRELLNRHNWDTKTNIPDHVLARHLTATLATLAETIERRAALQNKEASPAAPPIERMVWDVDQVIIKEPTSSLE